MNQDILFFSNYCEYSKKIINNLEKNKMMDKLMKICVDDPNINLPNFVEVVPLIYLHKKKEILIDDKLESWINSDNSNSSINTIESYATNSLSDSFSYLDDIQETDNNNYTCLDKQYEINTPTEDSFKKRSLEEMEKERSKIFNK